MPKKICLIGLRFGRGIVFEDAPKRGKQHYSRLRCDCGNIYEARNSHLRAGLIVSCGCYFRELMSSIKRTHGMSGTPEYDSWAGALQRCYNPNDSHFAQWGGRGIKMCEGLRESFENFFMLLGAKPKGRLLDRINNDGGYWCGKCDECTRHDWPMNLQWCTDMKSRRNKQQSIFFTVRGIKACLMDLCDHFGMTKHYRRVWTRIRKHKWSPERALTTPVWCGHGQMPPRTNPWLKRRGINVTR